MLPVSNAVYEWCDSTRNHRTSCYDVTFSHPSCPTPLNSQDFNPEPNTYDVIWIQWVIGHLADLDFISFFKRCAKGLKPGGAIVLKVCARV
jgi:AdoMet dependent proline di-methyltransferase